MSICNNWKPFIWYCVNCGTKVIGFRNENNSIKVECPTCKTVMFRTEKGKRHDTFDVYAPKNQVHI